MASGTDRATGRRLEGWPYTAQCLNEVATRRIGEGIMREYVGSLNPGLLVKENLMEGPIDRFVYAMVLAWELWVPMFDVYRWGYFSKRDERDGGFGLEFYGAHYPDAHLGEYELEENRIIRAVIASNAIHLYGK